MDILRFHAILAVVVLASATNTTMQCKDGAGFFPFDQALIGTESESLGSCNRFAPTTRVKITESAIDITVDEPSEAYYPEIVFGGTRFMFPFFKADKTPTMRYWPSDKKEETIAMWGGSRSQFKRLVSEATKLAEAVRSWQFQPCGFELEPKNFTRAEVRSRIMGDRITTAVINYLNTLAYRRFFCIV